MSWVRQTPVPASGLPFNGTAGTHSQGSERRQFWSAYCDVPDLDLDTAAIRALPTVNLSLDLDDAYSALEPVRVRAKPQTRVFDPIVAVVEGADGRESARVRLLLRDDEWYGGEVPPLPEGTYRVTVTGENMKPVTDVFAVFPAGS